MQTYRLEPILQDQGHPKVEDWDAGGFALTCITAPAMTARGGHDVAGICSLFRPSKGLVAVNSDRFRTLDSAPGDLSYFPAGTDFQIACDEPHHYAIVGIPPERLASFTADVCDVDASKLAATSPIRTPNAAPLTRLLLNYIAEPQVWGTLYRESLLTLVAAEAIRHASPMQAVSVRASLSPAVLRRVLDYIEEHVADDISLQALAAVAGLSPYHFARCFKQDVGRSPYRYVTDRRLQRAGRLLATTRLPVADIAVRCGFSRPGHFSTTFRRVFGVTPLRYRIDRS
ncbi:MAG TPA: AraC family transcriptional regulator [Azospirillum sp.]